MGKRSTGKGFTLYSGRDPRDVPLYSVAEAAHYLRVPLATLKSWVIGRTYPTGQGKSLFQPLVKLPHSNKGRLTFINLVEVHVLDAIRRYHRVPLTKVRRAIHYVSATFPSRHPLADQAFETDGFNLFVQKYGELINASLDGQLAMRELLESHLQRIERDLEGVAVRLYPFTRKQSSDEPKMIVIDPRISFGRPVLLGTGIPTAIIAERYKAGEPIDSLAKDYGRVRSEIEEAIRCELDVVAA